MLSLESSATHLSCTALPRNAVQLAEKVRHLCDPAVAIGPWRQIGIVMVKGWELERSEGKEASILDSKTL